MRKILAFLDIFGGGVSLSTVSKQENAKARSEKQVRNQRSLLYFAIRATTALPPCPSAR